MQRTNCQQVNWLNYENVNVDLTASSPEFIHYQLASLQLTSFLAVVTMTTVVITVRTKLPAEHKQINN